MVFGNSTTAPEVYQVPYAASVSKIIILALISVVGTAGNILVIVTINRERKLRIPGNYFIINLTVANLIITTFSIPVILANIVKEMQNSTYVEQLHANPFCQTSAYLKTIALHVSWYSLAFIALNRYYTVCRMNEYANHFTKKHVLVTIFLMWFWVLLINIPIMVGWAIPNGKTLSKDSDEGYYMSYPKHGPPIVYDQASHDCVLGADRHGGYTYATGLFVMAIPIVAIVFCYALVYMAMVESRRKMKDRMDAKQLRRRYKRERKISIMLTVVVTVFFVCWMPAIIYDYTTKLTMSDEPTDIFRLIVNWVALSNCAMNSILFAAMSKAFRIGYARIAVKILSRMVCGCCSCGKHVKEKLAKIRLSTSSVRTPTSKTSRFRSRQNRADSVAIETSLNLPTTTDHVFAPNNHPNTDANETGMLMVPRISHRRKLTRNAKTPADSTYKMPPGGRYSVVEINRNIVEPPNTVSEAVEKNTVDISTSVVAGNHTTREEEQRKFVPLLEQLETDNDRFTDEGIYLGPSPTRTVNMKTKLRASEIVIECTEFVEEPVMLEDKSDEITFSVTSGSDEDDAYCRL